MDTSSSSTCEEAVYDTGTASVINPDTVVLCYNGPSRPMHLSCIEEASCLSNSLESPNGLEDIVIHYDDDYAEEMKDDKMDNNGFIESNGTKTSPISPEEPKVGLESSKNNGESKQIDNTDEGMLTYENL